MAAHPIEILTPEPSGKLAVGPGRLLALRVDLPTNSHLVVSMIHTHKAQDSSLRVWFSREPGGSSIELVAPVTSYWHPGRRLVYKLCLSSSDTPATDPEFPVYSITAAAGEYFLNVLNLVNSPNGFHLELVGS